jgi:small subunit ribosomal protein S3
MGQKVNPNGMRLGISKDWTACWYASKEDYANFLNADIKAREYIRKKLERAAVSRIQIERPNKNARISIHSARPGVIIGKKGTEADDLRKDLSKIMGVPVHVTIEEIRKPDLDAHLVAQGLAEQLERRVMFRRALKRGLQQTMKAGAIGVRINISGRLGGAEIARTEWAREGRVPLHTYKADIDYGTARANTTYGVLGVKVWIYRGDVLSLERGKVVSTDNKNGKGRE